MLPTLPFGLRLNGRHTDKLTQPNCSNVKGKWPDNVFLKKLETHAIILIGIVEAEYIGCSFQLRLNLCFEFSGLHHGMEFASLSRVRSFVYAHKTF